MTIIVGIEHRGGVVLAADSQTGHQGFHAVKGERKLVRAPNYDAVFGLTGSPRAAQLLRYHGWPEKAPPKGAAPLARWVSTTYVEHVRQVFKDHGWMEKHDHQENMDAWWLLGVRGRLYAIHSDAQAQRLACGFNALGSGRYYALGALEILKAAGETRDSPAVAARKAVAAAINWEPSCGGPIRIEHVGR